MLFRHNPRQMTSRQLFSIGLPLMIPGLLLTQPVRELLPDFLNGFLLGISLVMMTCSIAINACGIARAREERNSR